MTVVAGIFRFLWGTPHNFVVGSATGAPLGTRLSKAARPARHNAAEPTLAELKHAGVLQSHDILENLRTHNDLKAGCAAKSE